MTSVYERLKNLQITLPGVPPCGGWLRCRFRSVCPDRQPDSFVGAARKEEWKTLVRQARRGDYHRTEGKQAARSVAIELLATLQAAIGDLNDLRRIVKLLVFVNSGRILRGPRWSPMALPNCSSKSLKREEPNRAAPWACLRFRLVAALRSRWLWRHLYRKVNANCEMHTKKRQSGYLSCSV